MARQRALLAAVLCSSALTFTAATPAAIVLIDNTTGNGGFENGTQADDNAKYTFAEIDDWFNDAGDQTAVAGNATKARTGTYRGMIVAGRSPAQDTGYPVALEDTFALSFWHRDFSGWDDGIDTFDAELYYIDGGGERQVLHIMTVSPGSAGNATWDLASATSSAVSDAGAVGRSLHVRFVSDAGGGEYASIDDVLLTATPIPEPTALVLLGAGALLMSRRR